MKTYKYWKKETAEILIDGKKTGILCFGRSNVSMEEASNDAFSYSKNVEARLAGKSAPIEDYTADIREEVVQEIDGNNIITRNRYGALVWNTESVTIIDIDQHKKSFLQMFGLKKRDNKTAIVEDMEKLAAKPEYGKLAFRIYETQKGVRVIVLGAYLDPNSAEAKTLLSQCHADHLYSVLCRKQKCYRARLTPKPHRIKQKAIKYHWPMSPVELDNAKMWVENYQLKSGNYAVCRYLKTLGKQDSLSKIVAFHDEQTKAASQLPLA